MLRRWNFILLVVFLSSGLSCQHQKLPDKKNNEVKNIIIVIGDGMGLQQIGLLNSYVKYAPDSLYKNRGRVSSLEKIMNESEIGCVYHEAFNVLVTDSAAASTQIATGKWARSETIGLDFKGNAVKTFMEKARERALGTGLVSDTRITHATPAAFAAHQTHRKKENAIVQDLLNNQIDILFSGGLQHWVPQAVNDSNSPIFRRVENMIEQSYPIRSKRKDDYNMLQRAIEQQYQLVFNRRQLAAVQGKKVIGLFSSSEMPDGTEELNMKGSAVRTFPTLREMSEKAVTLLSQNTRGFVLVIEAGQIDWACHDNDAGTLLHEMIRLDDTLDFLYSWVKEHPETLLIVTADHETGGFSFSYTRHELPEAEKLPGDFFRDEDFKPNYNFGSVNILDRIFAQKLSYNKIFRLFDELPENEQTPEKLCEFVNNNTNFPITAQDATEILTREENEYFVADHKYLKLPTFPKIHDFKEFYVYGNGIRAAILARKVAKEQMVVWSTGTHTNTPVPLMAWGPEDVTKKFSGLLHTTEWSQIVHDSIESR